MGILRLVGISDGWCSHGVAKYSTDYKDIINSKSTEVDLCGNALSEAKLHDCTRNVEQKRFLFIRILTRVCSYVASLIYGRRIEGDSFVRYWKSQQDR